LIEKHALGGSTLALSIGLCQWKFENEFAWRGSIVSRNRVLLALVVGLFVCSLAFANSPTVNVTYLHPGTNVYGGFYTYPYYFSVNGGSPTALMCDAFNNHVTPGESWSAHVSGLLQGKGMFGKDIRDYKAAGIIFLSVMNGTIDAKVGNWAVWNLFTQGITKNAAVLALDQNALALALHTPATAFKGLVLYTPVGARPGHGPQEFIGYNTRPLATPEPGSLLLLSTGLLVLASMVRRKLLHS